MNRASLETAIFFETPVQLCERVFRQLRPRTPLPVIEIAYRTYANAHSQIRLEAGTLKLQISDLFQPAPAPVLESLVYLLVAKLYRKPVPAEHLHRYRRYLNRQDVRRAIDSTRSERGHKLIGPAAGEQFDLDAMFDELNFKYFFGLMAKPVIGWSLRASRSTLGHYDAAHNTIVISKLLDRPRVPRLVAEYVLFHEMLHVRYPVDHKHLRRRVHTREFVAAEKQFEGYKEALELLKKLGADPASLG